MKDQLLDIVQHTHGLGVIDLAKVIGTENSTEIAAIAENKSVVVDAKFAGVVPEFIGTFGMPNLAKLNTILNINEYREDAQLTITTQPGKAVSYTTSPSPRDGLLSRMPSSA